MNFIERVETEINEYIELVKESQKEDGSWRYCFENSPATDAYMIIVLRILEFDEEEVIQKLASRLLTLQQANGSWKLFEDNKGNLSTTVEAYTALLISGYADRSNENMKKAESFILAEGRIENVHVSTKFMLALNGLYPWPRFFPFPLFLIYLPSFHKLSSYIRAHFAPAFILGYTKFSIHNHQTTDLSHLFLREKKKKCPKKPVFGFFSKQAIKKAEMYMLERIEADGTLYSYASATFYMIYALLALGYEPKCPMIQHAVSGLKSFLFKEEGEYTLQNSPATIWDSALLCYALQEAGVSIEDKVVVSAAEYILSMQQAKGGWGFSETNTTNPDVDDTQAALRAITRFSVVDNKYRQAWNSGLKWLFSMQHDNGGWSAFENNQSKSILTLLPIQNIRDSLIDSTASDLTGRTLEFLGTYAGMTIRHPKIGDAVNWLFETQEENGSWYGKWGISYIYGTWAAVTGLRAVGISGNHPSIQKAVKWLKRIQNQDGGWGESCQSDQLTTYSPLAFSTVVQTAWAVDSLISVYDHPEAEIENGIEYLLNRKSLSDKSFSYPTGAGLPGHFYIHYHSYIHIWPLLALGHYRNKYLKKV